MRDKLPVPFTKATGTVLRLLILVLLLPLHLRPLAAAASEPIPGDRVRSLFEGNTVSGRYLSGGLFTEYHHPDGRALGNNGWEENRDACWTTTENAVCYYYGPPKERTIHCFTVELTERLYVLKNVQNGRINALATIEPGNPRKHADGGKPWYCDGNISQAPVPSMSRRVLAAGT
ncbi:MAG: hypothetical protein ACRC56_05790, partial [Bosea sp. (in: a-proteobacteria)]